MALQSGRTKLDMETTKMEKRIYPFNPQAVTELMDELLEQAEHPERFFIKLLPDKGHITLRHGKDCGVTNCT